MDRKTLLVVVLCIAFWFGLNMLINKFFPPTPVRPAATNIVAVTQPVSVTNATGSSTSTTAVTTAEAPAPAPGASRFVIDTNTAEETLTITNNNARYTFTSHGGGLKLVELVGVATKKELAAGRIPTLNAHTPVPALAVLDGEAVQGNGIFSLTRTGSTVRAEKHLTNGLAVIKEFTPTSNYLVTITVRLENQSAQSLSLPDQKWVVGTATPIAVDDNGRVEGAYWYNGSSLESVVGASYFSSRGFACMPRTVPAEYREGQNNVNWAAAHNQFFTLIAMPTEAAAHIVVRPVDLPPPTKEEIEKFPRAVRAPKGYESALVYPAVSLAPNQSLQRQFTLYAGPKEYRTLARIATQFKNNVDLVMGFSGFFGFFSKALLLGMNWLHSALYLPYGWCIIAITFIIKLLFWPLTQASTRSMKRMQALQPQMKALQEKYKDDPAKAQRKLMEFWKENKVSPLGGCLPMLLQMPVFIGFFYMIRSAIELRAAPFLWVPDLSRPDTLFTIPYLNFDFNLLPLIMGATMLWQAHLTPPSPGMDPMQQKIMRYMPLIFMVFLYNYSSGLALYWTVNNLLTIVQTKLTKMQNPADATAASTPAAAKAPSPKAPALTPPSKKKK